MPLAGAAAPIDRSKLDAAVRLIDRISLGALCVGAFGVPLIYFWDTYDRFVLPKLLFARLLVLTLLALHAVRWAAAGTVVIRRTPLDLPILAFLASAVVSTVVAVNGNVALFGTYMRYEGLLTLATYAGLFWLAAQTAWRSDRSRLLIRAMLAGACVVSIFAVLQWVIASLTRAPSVDTGFSYGGIARAFATFSNPTMLGAFLAMLLPFAAHEVLEARSLASRMLAGNAVFIMSIALGLTFVRSAWLGAVAGLAITIAAPQQTPWRMRLGLSGAALAVILAVLAGGAIVRGGLPLIPSLVERTASIGAIQGSGLTRLHVWEGTIRLIISRPVLGYGPDTFGMVYPRFRTGDWAPGFIIDKAHAEVLQIAATQGLLGVAGYLSILGAAALAFWHGWRNRGAAAAFGGVVGYQLWAQANFSWVPAAVPYWLFLAAAISIWADELPAASLARVPRLPALAVALPVGVALIGLGTASALREWSADAHFYAGTSAEARDDLGVARATLAEARALAPEQSRYAFEAGRLALESHEPGQTRWLAAVEAYSEAARLGTYYSIAYYNLAYSDIQLGRREAAIGALHKALELSPGDPASLTLLAQVSAP